VKTTDEIKNKLAKEEEDLQKHLDKGFYLYENAGDYTRGWVDALRWSLREGDVK